MSRLTWIDKNLSNTGKCASIAVIPPSDDAVIYPNPVEDNATIKILSRTKQLMYVQVYGMDGKMIFYQGYQLDAGENNIAVKTAAWPKGIYTCRFTKDNKEKFSKRIMKK